MEENTFSFTQRSSKQVRSNSETNKKIVLLKIFVIDLLNHYLKKKYIGIVVSLKEKKIIAFYDRKKIEAMAWILIKKRSFYLSEQRVRVETQLIYIYTLTLIGSKK